MEIVIESRLFTNLETKVSLSSEYPLILEADNDQGYYTYIPHSLIPC
jgi:hypothetical protein